MKRFLIYAALFSAIVLAALGAGELIVRGMDNPYKIKDRFVKQHAGQISTAVLGSSHTFYGIVADSLGNDAINLANVAQNYEYDLRVLRHYEPWLSGLTHVVIPVSYFSFFDPPFEKSDEKWYEIYYRLYMGIDKYPLLSRYGFEISDTQVYAGKLRSLFGGKRRGKTSEAGFGLDYTLDDRDPAWKEMAEATVARHTAVDDRWTDYNISALDSLLSYCRDREIDVTMLTLPVSDVYRGRLDGRQLERTRVLTDSFAEAYGVNYFDFSSDPDFIDDDFHDPDHLSDRGAMRFTRIIRESILKNL
ncbi:MAG: hypothetical protein K2K55_08845 [Duncaniella sp.]|nr:hypothetical protein [Duncaniella sp.]